MTGMWGLAHLNAQSGVADTFWPLIIRGASVGFLFVPVNQLAIGSLKPAQVNQGVALLGLARQLGGLRRHRHPGDVPAKPAAHQPG